MIRKLSICLAAALIGPPAAQAANRPALTPERAAKAIDADLVIDQTTITLALSLGTDVGKQTVEPDWRVGPCRQVTPRRVECPWRFWIMTEYGRITTEGGATVAKLRSGYIRLRMTWTPDGIRRRQY